MLSDNMSSREMNKPGLFSRIHDAACAVCGLFAARYLLMCILTFGSAFQDWDKYTGLGSDRSLFYYLAENAFPDMVVYFLWICAELILYIVLCRRTEAKKTFWGSILYFLIMLAVHEVLWLHAHLFIPEHLPQFAPLDVSEGHYRLFAARSILPAITYFLLYLIRIIKLKRRKPAA